MSVSFYEDEAKAIKYIEVHFEREYPTVVQSILDGKYYGNAFRSQIKRVPIDVAEWLASTGIISSTNGKPLESVLSERDQNKLWEEWSEILKSAKLIPERYRPQFYSIVDFRLSYEENRDKVIYEARRLASLYAPIPPRYYPPVEISPGIIRVYERLSTQTPPPTLSREELPLFQEFLEKETKSTYEDFLRQDPFVQNIILRAFYEWLRRTGRSL